MASILEAIKKRQVLVSDGAWGTFLHQRGLEPGECPELWNVTHREDVLAIAKSYIDSGSDMVLTNSFGGSPSKLKHYGLDDRTFELNKAAAEISREAAGNDKFVLGSIGPTGVIMMMQEVPSDSIFEGFKIQAEGLVKGGVDAICIETISEIDEALIAIRAVKEISDAEIICTFTFEKTVDGKYKTMMGTTPTEMVQSIKDSGVSIIGANCGNGFENMIDIVKEIRSVDNNSPILIHANAGIPFFHEGQTVFPDSPEVMASRVGELIESGANIIGGCCGTTPEHIKVLSEQIRKIK
ncbi:MAG: homocysteine S-methyltransferase family protein [Melioribacteraceae bacterium]|nr:homocysteine S-methyltransferase family protein [Melioribacteraceae bacterium]